MPTNADPRRVAPTSSAGADLATHIRQARPLLLRRPLIDAVLAAQALAFGPVTSAQAQASRRLLRHPRAFTELARLVVRLGPDERGRRLCEAGIDRKGFALWWVEEPE